LIGANMMKERFLLLSYVDRLKRLYRGCL